MAAFEDPLPVPSSASGVPLEGAFVKGIDSLSWMANNTTKLCGSQTSKPHCWTFFSTAAFGKQNKVPQVSLITTWLLLECNQNVYVYMNIKFPNGPWSVIANPIEYKNHDKGEVQNLFRLHYVGAPYNSVTQKACLTCLGNLSVLPKVSE